MKKKILSVVILAILFVTTICPTKLIAVTYKPSSFDEEITVSNVDSQEDGNIGSAAFTVGLPLRTNCMYNIENEDGLIITSVYIDERGQSTGYINLPEGKYYLINIDYSEEPIEFDCPGNADIMLIAVYKTYRIELITDSGDPIVGAKFNLLDENEELILSSVTDSDGMIYVENLKPGKYYLDEVTVPGSIVHNMYEINVNEFDDHIIIEITTSYLPNECLIKIKAVDEKCNPIPNSVIEVYNMNNELVYKNITNESGEVYYYLMPETSDPLRFYAEIIEVPSGKLNTSPKYFTFYPKEGGIDIEIINYPEGYEFQKGDLDKNGAVNANDAAIALDLYKYGNVTDKDMQIGDMNDDGVINANDAALILDVYKYGK